MSHCARGFRRRERPRGSLGGARLRARGAARAGAGRGRTHQLVVRCAQGHGALVVLVFEHESHLRGVAGVELLDLRRELVDARRALRHGAEDRAGTHTGTGKALDDAPDDSSQHLAQKLPRRASPRPALAASSATGGVAGEAPRRCTGRGARGRCGRSDRGGRWSCVIRGAAAARQKTRRPTSTVVTVTVDPRGRVPRQGVRRRRRARRLRRRRGSPVGGRPARAMLRGAARPRPRVPAAAARAKTST